MLGAFCTARVERNDPAACRNASARYPAPSATGATRMLDLTVDELASELCVSRRTIERGMLNGRIVPTKVTASGRARFSGEYVQELKDRAAASKNNGYKYVMRDLGADRPRYAKGKHPPLSPDQFARQLIWRIKNIESRRRG